jgi:hypothetical protein
MRTAKSKLVRVDINKDVVAEASAAAAASKPGTNDWADKKQHYLVLRQRGGSVKWTVRGFKKQRVIGDPRDGLGRRDYLPTSAARAKAAQVYAELSGAEPAPRKPAPVLKAKVWTWADLDREYQASRAQPQWVNRRLKAPSQGTCDDIRLTFAKPPMQALHSNLLTELDRLALNAARDKIDGHRAKEKAIAYFKAAMTFAVDRHPDKSGLGDLLPWWEKLSAGDPDPKEMKAIEARRAALLAAKAAFSIDHLAEVLLRHEAYCAGRTGGEKISPGIRWGLWWVSHTANRRFSTVKFERSNFLVADELGPQGWGRAMWPAEVMKARLGFWLPLPPETVHLAASSIADWRQLVNDEQGAGHPDSRWVFASTVRVRDDDDKDRSVYPNSLNRHLQRMRAAGDLKDLSDFWLHLIRSVAANFLDNVKGLPAVASSLMLAHTIPKDSKDEAAPTTREFYLTSQRMDLKTDAMTAWTEALMNSYAKRGGKYPMPSEKGRVRKMKFGCQ